MDVILYQTKQHWSFFRVLAVIEDYLDTVVINPGESVRQNEKNIAIYARDVNQSRFLGAGAESMIDEKKEEISYDFSKLVANCLKKYVTINTTEELNQWKQEDITKFSCTI